MIEEQRPMVILTIDDEKSIRQSFRNFLEDYNFEVLEAENGLIGLEVFHRNRPDLVLVDLHMPELNGLAVLAEITKTSPDTPIIVVSGAGVMGDAVRALRLGAWNYLLKPVEDLTVLLHAVNNALEKAELIRENRRYKEHLEEMVKIRTAQLEKANKELTITRMQVIRKLGKAAEYKDNETGRHVIRVSFYSSIIAEALGLPEETVQLIRHCSPMHDIGKIGIPDHILKKPGPLDVEERRIMETHSEKGKNMLEPMSEDEVRLYKQHARIGEDILDDTDSELLVMARRIAACHHERWDGNGYPNRLKGEDIPIEARIVSVVDIYDALSTKRPYKDPYPEKDCQRIIKELSGSHLDPVVVDIFFENIDEILKIKEAWKD